MLLNQHFMKKKTSKCTFFCKSRLIHFQFFFLLYVQCTKKTLRFSSATFSQHVKPKKPINAPPTYFFHVCFSRYFLFTWSRLHVQIQKGAIIRRQEKKWFEILFTFFLTILKKKIYFNILFYSSKQYKMESDIALGI